MILPYLYPAWLTGFALAFARAVGEYGSVVFISGNMPMRTEISPLLIITKLEQFDYAGATAIALVMLLHVVRAAAGDQRAAGVDDAAPVELTQMTWLDPFTRAAHAAASPPRRLTEPPLVRWAADGGRAGVPRRCSWCCRWRRCSSRRSPTGWAPISARFASPTRWPR